MNKFNDFRFEGLDYREISNKYFTMNRISNNKDKIVIKVAACHIYPVKYGYAFILDATHVVYIKNWQISNNFYGIEIMLNKEYFKPVEVSSYFNDFCEDEDILHFEYYLEIAKEQQNLKDENGDLKNPVRWRK